MTNKSLLEKISLSRAEQRKRRLLEAEAELALEEADALKITEEQLRILAGSFLLVKTEFSDLDGLRWTQTALREFQSRHVARRSPFQSPSDLCHATSSVSGLSVPALSPDDTIRVAPFSVETSGSVQPGGGGPVAQFPCRHRDGRRSRSPIAGLFSACPPTQPCLAANK